MDPNDVQSTVLKFIWEFGSETERTEGVAINKEITEDFNEARLDDKGFLIVFMAGELKELKSYRRSEFGDIYQLVITQKGVDVTFQFVVKKGDVNSNALHDVITKILHKSLKFLE